eukprot:TRINITY_DN5381_c1_g5_i1.p2 TRINITY_DN5381_c1_g5~~TRINITY_DN5381_c1_g5_i1.p2  ORF type:complete len:257 (+),score=58.58 TRINITY_DN5381_c1_g5_i1:686-1456(+)
MEDGSVYACGFNDDGQLGLGDRRIRCSLEQVELPERKRAREVWCGGHHTIVMMEDGSFYACGANDFGQLVVGDTNGRNKLEQMVLPEAERVRDVQCGDSHTIVMMEDGSVLACGNNEEGQLALGDTTKRETLEPVVLPEGKRVCDVQCGGGHTMIVMEDGSVFACGHEDEGDMLMGMKYRTGLEQIVLPEGKRVLRSLPWSTTTHAMCAPKVKESVSAVMCAWWRRKAEDEQQLGALPVEVVIGILAMVEYRPPSF